MESRVEILRGPKLDANLRPMYFIMRNGRKVRIGWKRAMDMIDNGVAVEVDAFSEGAR